MPELFYPFPITPAASRIRKTAREVGFRYCVTSGPVLPARPFAKCAFTDCGRWKRLSATEIAQLARGDDDPLVAICNDASDYAAGTSPLVLLR